MRLVLVFGVVGQLLRYFSAAFTAPLGLALLERDWVTAGHFAVGLISAFVVGTLSGRVIVGAPVFHRSEALAVVSMTWLTVAVFAAIPFTLEGLSPLDALFESMSGLTTTGATILTDFSRFGDAFFLWRAMCQWFGGLGVIALFVVVLPRLGIAGRQLFFAEASGVSQDAISPHVRDAANRLWVVYGMLTATLALLLFLSGFSAFDALVHSFTTMAAGGFSPNPASIAGYDNPAAEWVLVVFMLLAGTSFTLQYRVFTSRPLGFFRDGEFVFYSSTAAVGAIIVAFIISGGSPDVVAFRQAAFQSASLISSTGFASTDYNLWADGARAVLVVVMVVGGCAGSAAGGPKAIRILLVLKRVRSEIISVLHPRAVLPLKYGGRPISDPIADAVFTLVALYLAGYFLSGIVLVVLGSDLVTGFSAALACFGNIGPGFGPAGPMGSFAGFSAPAKAILIGCMWIGRLEVVTVLALLHPDVWRNLHLRR